LDLSCYENADHISFVLLYLRKSKSENSEAMKTQSNSV
jgi:hypothetical protein